MFRFFRLPFSAIARHARKSGPARARYAAAASPEVTFGGRTVQRAQLTNFRRAIAN